MKRLSRWHAEYFTTSVEQVEVIYQRGNICPGNMADVFLADMWNY